MSSKESFYGSHVYPLDWRGRPFSYPGMVAIGTVGDGSCFFHAIAMAYYIPYREGHLHGQKLNRTTFIRNLRHDLSLKLADPVSSHQPDGPTHYDQLSRGQLRYFAEALPQYSLHHMQEELIRGGPVDNVYNEFVSNQLNKDIYLLDAMTGDVYMTGDDAEILYKQRDSIVILVIPGHYELVGLMSEDADNRGGSSIKTLFSPNHDFIQAIRRRMNQKLRAPSQ